MLGAGNYWGRGRGHSMPSAVLNGSCALDACIPAAALLWYVFKSLDNGWGNWGLES